MEYWTVIRDNIGWMCLLAIIGMGFGWLSATMRRPMFEARTVLDIRSLNENFLNPQANNTTGTTDSILPESYIQTEIKILQSDSLRKRTLDSIALSSKAPAERPDPSILGLATRLFMPVTPSVSELLADAGNRIKVRAVGNTRIVEVLCDAADGQLAATVCNKLSQTYIQNNLESRTQSTKETSDWLQSQLDDVRVRLTRAENALKDVGKATQLGLDATARENSDGERLRQYQNSLSRVQEERIVKQSAYEVAARSKPDTLPQNFDNGPIREYRLRLVELKHQLDAALVTMTPEHAKVRELQMQISDAEQALQEEKGSLVSRLRSDLDTSLQQERMISDEYDHQASLVSKLDDQAVRYSIVKHEVDSERTLYETLLQRVGEVGLMAAVRTSTILIVDAATAPLRPISPNMLASVSVGLLGGSALGLSFCLIRARSDRTLKVPGELASHLHLRELGAIPSLRGRSLRVLLKKKRTLPALAPGSNLSLDSAGEGGTTRTMVTAPMPARCIALATWLRVPGISEAYAAAMNSLLFASKDGTSLRVIVTTSPCPGDGKTTVATNLAIALAQIGRRVVIVDGDLRRPRLHTIFDVSAENGLAKMLEDPDLKNRPIHQILTATEIPNLFVVPTKPVRDDVSHRLHSPALRDLVDRLRLECDIVIIDSPPMLHISDARVLACLADGVVLVLRARKTTIDSAKAVYECLLQDGIRVLGAMLNDWDPKGSRAYKSYSSYFRVA